VENLQTFYRGYHDTSLTVGHRQGDKTVVVVAHRLSTVRNADQIVVLDKGQIAEIGTHEELVAHRAAYYHLVKNQLGT
jgi:ABC-type multidrug transport system fused ATPase/permease subunit